jgi:hypothetical protein
MQTRTFACTLYAALVTVRLYVGSQDIYTGRHALQLMMTASCFVR